MAHNILSRMQQAKQKEDPNDMYSAMLSDVKNFANTFQKAESDVALSKAEAEASQLRVAAAQAEVGKAESERDSMKNLYDTAKLENVSSQKKIKSLEKGVAQLRSAIRLEQDSALSKMDEYKSLLNTEIEKRIPLETEIANLKGKLSVKPKQVSQVKPSPIPSFTVSDVTHGSDNRINGATITPVRLN